MKKLACLLLTFIVVAVLVPTGMAAPKKPAPSLAMDTEYVLVAPPFGPLLLDSEGRPLIWAGTISGDINGVIGWYIDMEGLTVTGNVSHYNDHWVIWEGEDIEDVIVVVDGTATVVGEVLLEGEELGSTTAGRIWRGNGVVTGACDDLEDWIGRQTHADGNAEVVEFVETPEGPIARLGGTGTLRVN